MAKNPYDVCVDVPPSNVVVPSEEVYKVNTGPDTPDHCQLVHLSQPTLLENTRQRFETDKIHTYVGDILVVGVSKVHACRRRGRLVRTSHCSNS